MRRIRSVALLAALLMTVTLPGRAAPTSASDGTGPLDTATDLAAALRFEAQIPEHTFYGMVVPLLYDEWPHLVDDATPLRMHGEGDSGNYTGVYLAAQSWRYSQAKAEIAKLGGDPLGTAPTDSAAIAFWRAQRDEALARGREIVSYYSILVNISAEWQTELDPEIDTSKTPDQSGWLDYGGGVVPGEAGLLMRTCTPENPAPAFADVRMNYSQTPYVIGPLPWSDGRDWYCIGNTSRDSYMGTLFGLSVAFDYLATDENPDLRASLANDLMAMTDYAAKYLWNQPRPHGYVANPITDNDLNGPVSPLFIQVPLARLHLLQTARHAATVIGDAEAQLRYEALWLEEVANTVAAGTLYDSMVIDSMSPHNAYYKYQLHLMSFFDIIRLEPDPVIRTEFARSMGVLDASLTDDGNPFFEAMTYALTHEPSRLEEAVGLHREWLDYYDFHARAALNNPPFVHTGRCSITEDPGEDAPIERRPLECRQREEVNMVQPLPNGDVLRTPFRPGTGSAMRAKDPLPVGVRRYADFLWQKDPTIITGDHDEPWRGPSIDFLATYWMLRYYSEVEVSDATDPLPAYPGPRFE